MKIEAQENLTFDVFHNGAPIGTIRAPDLDTAFREAQVQWQTTEIEVRRAQ